MTITQEDNLLIQSYITVSFLLELKNLDFLNSDYYKNAEFQDKYVQESITTIGIDNQGSMLMALYAMLVIPKEKIKSRFESEFDKLNEVVNTIKMMQKLNLTTRLILKELIMLVILEMQLHMQR